MLRLLLTLGLLCACFYFSLTYPHETPEAAITIAARRANKAQLATPTTGTLATFAAQQQAASGATIMTKFPAFTESCRADGIQFIYHLRDGTGKFIRKWWSGIEETDKNFCGDSRTTLQIENPNSGP